MATCKFCGSQDVQWVKTKDGFRLYNISDGTWHNQENGTCKPDQEFQKNYAARFEKWKAKRKAWLDQHPLAKRDKFDIKAGL